MSDAADAGAVLARSLAAALNHLLRGAPWARARLKPFAGNTVRFEVAPIALALSILPDGEVEAVTAAGPVEASFVLTPGIALRLAADENAWQEVQASGDMALAREVLFIARNLRWDAEEDLSRVIGDIAAHRTMGAVRALHDWQQEAAASFARSAVAYWTEEQPLIATRHDLERFAHAVDILRDDVARLEKRIANLASGIAP